MDKRADASKDLAGEELTLLFRHAFKLMARSFHHDGHIQHAQNTVPAILKMRNPISQRELMDALRVRSASLSEVLGKMERGGLIIRERNKQDKRGFVVAVTERGRAMTAIRERGRQKSSEVLFMGLDAKERRELGALLKKIIYSLEEDCICSEPACRRGGGFSRDGRCGLRGGRGKRATKQ